jgi:hypothetical protein
MRIFAIGLSLLAGAGEAIAGRERYTAQGENPDWVLTIDANVIRLAVRPAEGRQAGPRRIFLFPRVAPARSGDRSVWTSSTSRRRIIIESEFAPRSSCSQHGPEAVRVIMDGREYRGCGGRPILVRAH